MTCTQPVGETKVIFDASQCASNLVADGVSSCRVNLELFYDFDEAAINDLGFVGGENGDYSAEDLRIPQPNTQITMTMLNAVASVGSVVTATSNAVLSATADGAELLEEITLERTERWGTYFYFLPTLALNRS